MIASTRSSCSRATSSSPCLASSCWRNDRSSPRSSVPDAGARSVSVVVPPPPPPPVLLMRAARPTLPPPKNQPWAFLRTVLPPSFFFLHPKTDLLPHTPC